VYLHFLSLFEFVILSTTPFETRSKQACQPSSEPSVRYTLAFASHLFPSEVEVPSEAYFNLFERNEDGNFLL